MRTLAEKPMYERAEIIELRGMGWTARPVVARYPATSTRASRRFVLLHGNPSNLSEWVHTVDALREVGEVVALDLPGFGRSEPLIGVPTLNTFADVVAALTRELGWSDADLVGQSHGGLVSHTVAARHPERVRSIVFLGTGGTPAHLSYRLLPMPGVRALLGSFASKRLIASRLFRPSLRLLVEYGARGVFAPDPVPDGFVESQVEEFGARAHILRTMVEVTLGHPCAQVAQQASLVRAPCLFVHGTDDQLVPIQHARRLYELTRATCSARFIATGGGHMVHLTRPNVVNPLIVSWLRELSLGVEP